MLRSVRAVVLAGGKGTRLNSEHPKVLHALFGKPLLVRVLETLTALQPEATCVVVGHGRTQVLETLHAFQAPYPIHPVVQEPQLGTGHALMQVREQLREKPDDWENAPVLILSGDVPLLRADSLRLLLDAHQRDNNDLTLLTAHMENPSGYGRVLMRDDHTVIRIVEEKDASASEKAVSLVNAGIYCMDWRTISPLLDRLSNRNAQGEFYLTDLVALSSEAGLRVGAVPLGDATEMSGVNSRADLAFCHDVLNRRTLSRLMDEGVTLLSPATTLVATEVRVGRDTTLLPGCTLQGDVTIGERCVIGPHTTMSGTVIIADDVTVTHSVVRDARIDHHATIGPFAQLRDNVVISHHVNIGNFVEVKKTRIDSHTNAAHLAYLGDATLGGNVNIGAGVITANYDPVRDVKSQTSIEDGAKIGSNVVLVAPVSIGRDASVAAGSVITHDVRPGDLAIARERQTDIPGWVARARQRSDSP